MTETVRFGSGTPRLFTPVLDLPSRGQDVLDLAAECGVELMPWQRHVIMEAHRVKTNGKWAHRLAGVTAPRQNGKSALMRFVMLTHLFKWDSTRLISMAQNRSLALDHFKQAVDFVESVPWMQERVKRVNRTNGQEALEVWKPDGKIAKWEIVAATMDGPRGRTADVLWIDELREIGEPAWKAATPVTRARPNAQVWVTSNAGDAHSVVLNEVRDRALIGLDPATGWWEWSAPNSDPHDVENWYASNGALGYLIDEDVIRSAAVTESPGAFSTETLCVWVDSLQSPWPPNAWSDCGQSGLELPPGNPMWLALDVSLDRRSAYLVGAQQLDGDKIGVGLLAQWDSEGAVDDRKIAGDVADFVRKYQAVAVGFDKWTGAGIAQQLSRVGIQCTEVSGAMFGQACDETLSAMVAGRLLHSNQPELSTSVLACAKKPMADGGWRVVRRGSTVPISAAVAMITAIHLASEPPASTDILFA